MANVVNPFLYAMFDYGPDLAFCRLQINNIDYHFIYFKCRKNNGNGDTNDLPDTDESNKKMVKNLLI